MQVYYKQERLLISNEDVAGFVINVINKAKNASKNLSCYIMQKYHWISYKSGIERTALKERERTI